MYIKFYIETSMCIISQNSPLIYYKDNEGIQIPSSYAPPYIIKLFEHDIIWLLAVKINPTNLTHMLR